MNSVLQRRPLADLLSFVLLCQVHAHNSILSPRDTFVVVVIWTPPVEVLPRYTLRFYSITQYSIPAAPQEHCGRCRNRTRDLCPRSALP